MNDNLVMDLANNITWLALFCFISGLLIGWYVTFTHYRQKERERQAVLDYKRRELGVIQLKSDLRRIQDAMNELQCLVTHYHIESDVRCWDYDIKEKEE